MTASVDEPTIEQLREELDLLRGELPQLRAAPSSNWVTIARSERTAESHRSGMNRSLGVAVNTAAHASPRLPPHQCCPPSAVVVRGVIAVMSRSRWG
jgi:hypothetical protein